jgi:uncharacterized membrane protein YphA (DoxX/SURF4 family)
MSQPEEAALRQATGPYPTPGTANDHSWNAGIRLAFRLVFAYEILYSFPFPLNLLPWSDKIFGWHEALFSKLTVWTGAHILHLSRPAGIFLLCRRRLNVRMGTEPGKAYARRGRCRHLVAARPQAPNYRAMQEWLWLYVRLVLGAAMIGYGAIKVIKVQFPDLFLWRLLSPYGDSSPTGLLWSFMGYSRTYNLFTGLVELTGGALLFVPRLVTLGALICVGSMANVFMLNVSYDVSVKLYSLNLLLMGVYLMASESRRLLDFFVLNRPAPPAAHAPLFRRRWLNSGVLALPSGRADLCGRLRAVSEPSAV